MEKGVLKERHQFHWTHDPKNWRIQNFLWYEKQKPRKLKCWAERNQRNSSGKTQKETITEINQRKGKA